MTTPEDSPSKQLIVVSSGRDIGLRHTPVQSISALGRSKPPPSHEEGVWYEHVLAIDPGPLIAHFWTQEATGKHLSVAAHLRLIRYTHITPVAEAFYFQARRSLTPEEALEILPQLRELVLPK